MSVLFRSREERAAVGPDLPDVVREMNLARMSGSWAGVTVTPDNVLTVPAVFAAEQFTAGVISQLPFDQYRKAGDGRVEVEASPLLTDPSGDVAAEDWRFQAVESAQLHGNTVGVIAARDRMLRPTQIEIVAPKRAQVRVAPGTRVLEWRIDGVRVPSEDVWHMVGRPQVGSPLGVGLVEFMAEAAGVGLAARKYGADWFGSGGAPVAVFKPAKAPASDAEADSIKARLVQSLRRRAPLVMGPNDQAEQWPGTSPSDAALVELLRQNATDIAMFYALPAELLGGQTGDSQTYKNTENRIIDLLAFGVAYWLAKLEHSLTRMLPAGQYAKANEAAIVRTDLETKVRTLGEQIRSGLATQNEGRRLLDRPPVDGGDQLLWPPFTTTAPTGGE